MASLRKIPGSKNWIACYTDLNRVRRQQSTGTSDRKVAQEIADGYERAAREAKTETQIRKVISDIAEDTLGKALVHLTCDGWFDKWLKQMAAEVKATTLRRYTDCVVLARKFGASMCCKRIDLVLHTDVRDFRDELRKHRAAGTTNTTIKTIRQAFRRARVDGLLLVNPAEGVKKVKRDPTVEVGEKKRKFTLDQVKALLAVAPDAEWRGMLLAGFYSCGQRLGDICTLLARQIDLENNVVTFAGDDATIKTGRTVEVPIMGEWRDDLATRLKGMKADSPLFPRAFALFGHGGDRVGMVSNQFYTLLVRAGISVPWKKRFKEADCERRRTNAYSWHSFRYTGTSHLKNNGVGSAIAMDLVGHDSAAISENYTQIDLEVKRSEMERAMGKLILLNKNQPAA